MMGHRADRDMICGTAPVITKTEDGGKMGNVDKKPVKDLFPSVVIVGLWDNEKKEIVNVGSGFIANKKLGLVVTAGHIFFDMAEGSSFGAPYHGLRNASAIIGVIPNGKKNNTTAVFRYVAKIVADDIHNMDACILKITSRLESDVHNHELIAEQPKIPLENLQEESLSSLNITKRYEIEQAVRIIGFNQGGEGRLKMGEHVNTASDFALGYICKQFKIISDDSSTSSDDSSSSEEGIFMPREEIVVMCKTIKGHSGGPCVNDDGKVVGILSRSDPVDRQRCYLVPSSEIKLLISKAKNRGVGKGY
jgi:CBS domain-containing protein